MRARPCGSPDSPASSPETSRVPQDLINSGAPGRSPNCPLFSYFAKDPHSNPIRSWSSTFPTDNTAAFCEILTVILQIAGHRIQITPPHIQGDAYESVLNDFQEAIADSRPEAPLTQFLRDKHNKLDEFWREITDAMISGNMLFSESFGSFRQWIIVFTSCKIRILRLTSAYFAFTLFTALATAIARNTQEIDRLSGIDPSTDAIGVQIETFNRELQLFQAVSNHLYQHVVIPRVRDVEPQIRLMPITSLTECAVAFPAGFGDSQKLKYVGGGLNDPVAKNRLAAVHCFTKLVHNLSDEILKILMERFGDRISQMCDDTENSVVAATLDCLLVLNERGLIDFDCAHAADLLSDDSTMIRAAAAKFVAAHAFAKAADLGTFVRFGARIDAADLEATVHSLFAHVKCLRDPGGMCAALLEEDSNLPFLARVLEYSCAKMATASENKCRKMTIALVKNLPKLIRAFQTDRDIVLPLVSASRLLSLDAVGEAAADHQYEQLLREIRELFIGSADRDVYTAAIASLYELSTGRHQLSEIARQELNRLAVDCGRIEEVDHIGKFVAAARLVDVSDGGKLRERIIERLRASDDDAFVADCIECVEYFFRWDVTHICNRPDARRDYFQTFQQLLALFDNLVAHASRRVREQAFRALACVLALSPLLEIDEIPEDVVDRFFDCFHKCDDKLELFDCAQKPLQTHAIDIAFAPHVLVYFGSELLQPLVKTMWKELAKFGPVAGGKVLAAFRKCALPEPDMKAAARFMVGKVNAADVVAQWLENEEEALLGAVLPFFFGLTAAQGERLVEAASEKFQPILRKIAAGEKPTQRMISAVASPVRSPTKRMDTPGASEIDEEIEFEEPEETFVSRRSH
jgi:hypothetical protein